MNSMKHMFGIMALGVIAVLLAGCATPYPTGFLFTEVKLPAIATANKGGDKVGVSECTSILGLIATGDASIEAAAKSAGITKIHSVDWEAKNILGIYGVYKTVVRGE